MKFPDLLVVALAAATTATAQAGVPGPETSGCFPSEYPCPPRCGIEAVGQGTPCQFRFRADGGLDDLVVLVTLRDWFDVPVPDCLTTITLAPNAGTLALCGCCPLQQTIASGLDGTLAATWSSLGGRGSLDVAVTASCAGPISVGTRVVDFTTPDLDGTCEPGASTGLIDLAIFAGGLPPSPYMQGSDYHECDGLINVIDLAVWAGGLGLGCEDAICP